MPGLVAILGGNSTGVDAAKEEAEQREKYPLLFHPSEKVELAFQVKGFGRDKSFFTTHRILLKDGKGIGNKRKHYDSVPYTTIKAFAVETAGAILDGDIELKVWCSGGQYHKIEFAKKEVNIWTVQQFMNAKLDWSKEVTTTDRGAMTANVATEANQPIAASKWQDEPSSSRSSRKKVGIFDWLGGNAHTMDPHEAQVQLTTVTPVLMENETVHMAFRERRDCLYFTSHRLLEVDVQGMTGKKVEFKSIPWRYIRGFSVQSAGAFLDRDSELTIFTNIRSMGCLKQDFRQTKVDLMQIQRYISDRILGVEYTPIQEGLDLKEGHEDPKTSWFFRDNQRPLDAKEIDEFYHGVVPILQEGEHVELAFKGRRDVTLLTTKRFIDIDPKGLSGKRIEYTSIPWTSVLGFGAKTQGAYLDSDSEFFIYTDMMFYVGEGDAPDQPGMSYLEVDLNPRLTDAIALKNYMAKKLLCKDKAVPLDPGTFDLAPKNDGKENWIDWLGSNQRSVDPLAMEAKLREGENILLLEDERVIMGFKAGRDTTIFTDKRLIEADVQGLSGKKVRYTSVPYSSIRAFKVESAGAWDRDSELAIYTRNMWDLGKLKMDFRKGKADIVAIQKFLSAVVLGTPEDATRFLANFKPYNHNPNPPSTGHFMSWLGNNSKEENADDANDVFHRDPPILLSNEIVNRAFRKGRDLFLFTTHRILEIDVQGMRGKKVEYKTYPIKWCRTFAIETAGNLDRDAELYVDVDCSRRMQMELSILVKKHDIYQMHSYLTNQLVFPESAPSVEEEPDNVMKY